MPKKLLVSIVTASLLIGTFVAAPAHASPSQESVFQDDATLVFSGDAKRQAALDEIKALGGTTIHSLVFWNRIAPDPDSKTRPAGFDAGNPASYPGGAWAEYDQLVLEAQARGLSVILSPVKSPAWASSCKGSSSLRHRCKPKVGEFQQFVTALGRRYPMVHRWSMWNEPNQSGWLYPQRQRKHGHIIPTAAIMYRNLFRAGTAALAASGHGRDQILLGETAPLGRRTGSLANRFLSPTELYQGVFCLDSRGHKLRGRIARDEGCGGRYQRLAATGIAHHPYNRGGSQPPTRRPGPGEITIANISSLSRVVDQGAHNRRIRRGLPFYFTEFGFQSNPPDRTFGVSLSRQARYINQSDFIAYRSSRVRAVSQYELFDEPLVGAFNTGLRLKSGKAKPALAAYRLPIWVSRNGSGVRVWGWVRPAGGTAQTLQIQNGNKKFRTVKTARTSSRGFFLVRVRRQPGHSWRFLWTSPAGTHFASRKAGIGT